MSSFQVSFLELQRFSQLVQLDVHLQEFGCDHIHNLLASVRDGGLLKIEQYVVNQCKSCVGVNVYM
jgi:hypothetical protein